MTIFSLKYYLMALCALLSGFLPISTAVLGAGELILITEDYPPLNFVADSKLQGPSVDIVKAIQMQLGDGNEIKVYPWARGYHLLETTRNTALFSTTRTESREYLFKWVGPLAEKKIGLFARKGSAAKPNSLDEAKAFMIGVQRGGVGMQYLGERGLENFDDSTTPLAILKKLMAGRVDLWFARNATVAGNTKILGIDADEIELVLELENTHMYIAFNGDTPDATVAEWQSAYDSLVKEGKVAEILARYGLEGLYPTLP